MAKINPKQLIDSLDWLRRDIIGRNMPFKTPYGIRPLVYSDFTASGRGLRSIENYIQLILQYYANTHTEDDHTGWVMTRLLHEAEHIIKRLVNAGPKGRIIFTESGTTGGITRLQQILGVYISPATKRRVEDILRSCLKRNPAGTECNQKLFDYMHETKPIVFVGPYEHHSNEIMWRQTLCEIVEVPLGENDELDLAALQSMASDPVYDGRLKIGSFSAASNVTGLKTPVYEVARILHRHNALSCFDFAACAPYVPIDMNRDAESYFDAIYLSPHKFLGGPGGCGILVFNSDLYPSDLPPTIAAGGTVSFVTPHKEEYIRDIETREKPGTPGILQALRVALAFQVKQKVGLENIAFLEEYYYERFMAAFEGDGRIIFYGPQDVGKKVPIVPFNIRHRDRVLHPKFVTRLLNDLFGIQSRAGCSCAGPYGHHLMKIGQPVSNYYSCVITNLGYGGIKPGWVRLNLHYAMDESEVDYLIEAVKFVLDHGHKFLGSYEFDIANGEWRHLGATCEQPLSLDLDAAYEHTGKPPEIYPDVPHQYREALETALGLAHGLPEEVEPKRFEPELEALMYFYMHHVKYPHGASVKHL